MQRIVVGVDGSEPARRALRWAADEAGRRGAILDVMYAWHVPYAGGYSYLAGSTDVDVFGEEARLVLNRLLSEANLDDAPGVEPILVEGSAARSLLDAAKGADLLVVGRRGRGGFAELVLGSVSHQVSLHAPCPVAIFPNG